MGNKPPSPAAFHFAVYIPTLTGSLSVLGSAAIISSILLDPKTRTKKIQNPQNRILLGLSIYDLLYSLNKALLFLTYPSNMGIKGAQGNLATCELQGFLTHYSYAAGLYSCFLSIYYYLTVCHGMRREQFQRYIEPAGHFLIGGLILTFQIICLSIGLYNPTGAFCFIAPYPMRCNGNPNIDCERHGNTFSWYYQFFGQLWIQLSYVVILYTNASIWYAVYQQEKKVEQYTYRSLSRTTAKPAKDGAAEDTNCRQKAKQRARRSRKVAVQSILYVGAFFLSWTFVTVYHLISWIGKYSAFWALILINILTPLQGFWNAIFYARPTLERLKRQQQLEKGKVGSFRKLQAVFLPTTIPARFRGSMTTRSSATNNTRTSTTQFLAASCTNHSNNSSPCDALNQIRNEYNNNRQCDDSPCDAIVESSPCDAMNEDGNFYYDDDDDSEDDDYDDDTPCSAMKKSADDDHSTSPCDALNDNNSSNDDDKSTSPCDAMNHHKDTTSATTLFSNHQHDDDDDNSTSPCDAINHLANQHDYLDDCDDISV